MQGNSFRQELKLEDGYIEIESEGNALVKLWVDVFNPVVHVDVDFKLHAPENTFVEAVLKNGEVVKLIVTPEERREDLIVYYYSPQNKQIRTKSSNNELNKL